MLSSAFRLISLFILLVFGSQAFSYLPTVPIYSYDTDAGSHIYDNRAFGKRKYDYNAVEHFSVDQNINQNVYSKAQNSRYYASRYFYIDRHVEKKL